MQWINDSQRINDFPQIIINDIIIFLKGFICKEFIYKDFDVLHVDKSSIKLILEETSVKGDMISLYKRNIYENDHQEIYTEKVDTIDIDNECIQLEWYIIQDYQETHTEKGKSVSIFTDEIRYDSLIIQNDHHRDYTKEVKEEMEYRNKIRYIILKNIMLILLKHLIKSAEKLMMKNIGENNL